MREEIALGLVSYSEALSGGDTDAESVVIGGILEIGWLIKWYLVEGYFVDASEGGISMGMFPGEGVWIWSMCSESFQSGAASSVSKNFGFGISIAIRFQVYLGVGIIVKTADRNGLRSREACI